MSSLRKQSKKKATCGPNHPIGLKRGRASDESTDSADSFSMPCSPTPDQSLSIEIDLGQRIQDEDFVTDEIKNEPIDEEMDTDLLETGLDEVLIETVKNEVEDDPLTIESGMNEENKEFENPCDEDFVPGSSENLPLVDTVTVTEVLMTFPDEDKLRIRELWRRDVSRRRVSYGQLKQLWEYLSQNKAIATGFNKTSQAREFSKNMWENIAHNLNSHGDGAIKNWKGWCKYWNDYKSKLKKFAAATKASHQQTGGGPSLTKKMTDLEKKFLQILGDDFGTGLPGIRVEPFEHVIQETDTPLNIGTGSVPTVLEGEGNSKSVLTLCPVQLNQETSPEPGPSTRVSPPPPGSLPTLERTTTGAPNVQNTSRRSPRLRRHMRREPPMTQDAARRALIRISERRANIEEKNSETFKKILEEMKGIKEILRSRPPEELNDQIGYVQVKRDEDIYTIKCEVATKTTSNQIVISYDETNHIVLKTICDCARLYCSHVMTGLIWLSRPVSPGTHWLQPMVTRDPSTLTIKALFGIPKKENVQPTFDVLGEFLGMCKVKKLYSPAIMKYYFEDDRTKASLHILICNYQKTAFTNVDSFLNYCKENITKKDCCDSALDSSLPLDVVQELMYGRITNDILHEVSNQDSDVEALLDKITLPEPEEKADLPADAFKGLEKSLKMKISKCGLLISKEYPMFAAYPYGTTKTHVVQTKRITDSSNNKVKITPEIFASMQLQMFLAKKENACYCVVSDTNRVDVMMAKYNKTMITELIERAIKFWKSHVFDRINMN